MSRPITFPCPDVGQFVVVATALDRARFPRPLPPYAGAPKQLTHNQAPRISSTCPALCSARDPTTPPASGSDGYTVIAGASGIWVRWDVSVPSWTDGARMWPAPRPVWRGLIAGFTSAENTKVEVGKTGKLGVCQRSVVPRPGQNHALHIDNGGAGDSMLVTTRTYGFTCYDGISSA